MKKKVVLIGGSFDPVHKGHEAMARAAISQLQADEVWFVPSAHTPLKDRHLTNPYHRLNMLEQVCKNDPRFKLCDIELKRGGKSYTVDTLRALKNAFDDIDFTWLIGQDQAAQFDQWKDPEEVLKLARIGVVARPGSEKPQSQWDFDYVEMEPVDVSSTEIRMGNKLNYLDEKVLQYILDNELYLLWWVKSRMSDHRFAHSCSVARLARSMAAAHGLDEHKAWLAGMFHDIAKEMPLEELEKWVQATTPVSLKEHHAIFHGYAGAAIADRIFGIHDPMIKNAIFNHVKGTSYDPYAMIIYAADKLDPLRDYDSRPLISACMTDLYNGFMAVRRQNKAFLEKSAKKKD